MAVDNIAPTFSISSVGSAWNALARMASRQPPEAEGAAPAATEDDSPAISQLSRAQLWTALASDGMTTDAEMLALAETFSRVGAPIDEGTLTAARALLARMPDIQPAAVALANMLGVGKSTAAINALNEFLEGLPVGADAEEVAGVISVAVGPDIDRQTLASAVRGVIANLAQSTENRLLAGEEMAGDARATLLMLAGALRGGRGDAAAGIAGHITGQQMFNQTSIARFDPPVPLYFAFYLQEPGGKRTPAELQVWSRPGEDENPHDRESASTLNVTIRVTPSALGLLQAMLSGTMGGMMTVALAAERPATYRLLRRHASLLAAALTAAGWEVRAMTVDHTSDFSPLWYGGQALAQPRSRIDQKA